MVVLVVRPTADRSIKGIVLAMTKVIVAAIASASGRSRGPAGRLASTWPHCRQRAFAPGGNGGTCCRRSQSGQASDEDSTLRVQGRTPIPYSRSTRMVVERRPRRNGGRIARHCGRALAIAARPTIRRGHSCTGALVRVHCGVQAGSAQKSATNSKCRSGRGEPDSGVGHAAMRTSDVLLTVGPFPVTRTLCIASFRRRCSSSPRKLVPPRRPKVCWSSTATSVRRPRRSSSRTRCARVVPETLKRPVEIYSEYLDIERFPVDGYAGAGAEFLRQKYSDRNIRVIVASAPQAVAFATKFRESIASRRAGGPHRHAERPAGTHGASSRCHRQDHRSRSDGDARARVPVCIPTPSASCSSSERPNGIAFGNSGFAAQWDAWNGRSRSSTSRVCRHPTSCAGSGRWAGIRSSLRRATSSTARAKWPRRGNRSN